MQLGVLLPTFRDTPADALAAADEAAAAGLDGVFAYDHVWPMGSPERSAIAPFEVLASVAHRQPTLAIGPLVARVALVGDEVLLAQCRALRLLAGARTILALGTGDRLSEEENLAYGVPFSPPELRRDALEALASTLVADGAEVWIGDGSSATRAIAPRVGATLNLWDKPPAQVADAASASAVSWAGPAPQRDGRLDEPATSVLVAALARAGATWAVFSPQVPIRFVATLLEVARSDRPAHD
jgi:Luciferase-like monooxygenase